jgi:hypothetical protein
VPLSEETLASRDCVCLAVAHRAFDHAMAWLLTHSGLLLDATGAPRPENREAGRRGREAFEREGLVLWYRLDKESEVR